LGAEFDLILTIDGFNAIVSGSLENGSDTHFSKGSARHSSRGVLFHHLTGIFATNPESIYIDNCCHFNQAGNEIMADAIAGAILRDPATEKNA
jgi:hypothetical protein